jgi:hypothetical protein
MTTNKSRAEVEIENVLTRLYDQTARCSESGTPEDRTLRSALYEKVDGIEIAADLLAPGLFDRASMAARDRAREMATERERLAAMRATGETFKVWQEPALGDLWLVSINRGNDSTLVTEGFATRADAERMAVWIIATRSGIPADTTIPDAAAIMARSTHITTTQPIASAPLIA